MLWNDNLSRLGEAPNLIASDKVEGTSVKRPMAGEIRRPMTGTADKTGERKFEIKGKRRAAFA